MFSFVVCSIDASTFAAFAHNLAGAAGSGDYELVGIHDAASLCDGWSDGLARSAGDPVLFCHDDIATFVPDLLARVARHLERYDRVGVAGTDRCVGMDWAEAGIEHAYGAIVHDSTGVPMFSFYGAGADEVAGIEAMDGVFLAVRRDVAKAVDFDRATFDGWHGYDADFTYRARRAGARLAVVLDLPIVHRSEGTHDVARTRYHRRFAVKHGKSPRPERGPWVGVRLPIAVPDGIASAFDRANLDRWHAWTRDEAKRMREAAERPYAAGRNAPCPCGSGLRYKECHGAAR